MSRLWRRGESWYVDYVDERGNRVRKALLGVETKRQAEGELAELVAQVRRRKLGLQPTAASSKMTVWGLVDWWLSERCPEASAASERGRLEKHVKGTELAGMPVVLVETTHFEALFSTLARPHESTAGEPRPALSGASVNHVRAKLRTAFERARREGKFTGVNPLLDTEKLAAPRRSYETLTLEEVPRALAMVAPQWRGFIATAIFLGLRKGEIGGMHKVDVDLAARIVWVRRSWERQTTKGGAGAELPLVEPLVPYLEAALKTPGPYLFPGPKGGMLPRESDPHLRLATALKRAGIVDGYRVWCNRCPPELAQVVTSPPAERPRCAVHKRLLWVTALPRKVRLHDMRHSTATILLRAGVPLHHVQRIMRHADPQTTASTYAHLVTPDLRRAMAPLEGGTNQTQQPPNPDSPQGAAMQNDSTIPARFERATPGFGGRDLHRVETRAAVRAVSNGAVPRTSEEGELSVSRAEVSPAQSVLAQTRHSSAAQGEIRSLPRPASGPRSDIDPSASVTPIVTTGRSSPADRSNSTTARRPFRGGMRIDDEPDPPPASSTAGVRHG